MKRWSLFFTPSLFAIYPVLAALAHNREYLRPIQVLLPLVVFLALGVFIQGLVLFLTRDGVLTAILSALYLAVFFGYGHLSRFLGSLWPILGYDKVLLPAVLAGLFLLTRSAWKRRAGIIPILKIFFVVGIVMVAVPLAELALTGSAPRRPEFPRVPEEKPRETGQSLGGLPDIYYIIPDRYTNERILREEYGYDNSSFLDYLRARGFFVVPEAYANYPKTAYSLASSLNMSHLLEMAREIGPDLKSWVPLHQAIEDNRVIVELKKHGYRYIHFGTWWLGTQRNRNADLTIDLMSLSEFGSLLYRNTMAYPVGRILGLGGFSGDERKFAWERTRHQFDRLENMGREPGPKFVFAHLIAPHQPYVFNPDGSFRTEEEEKAVGPRENYVAAVKFVNNRLKSVIERIQADSAIPPIIIIQSDEGPFPAGYEDDQANPDWRKASPAELRVKLGIINALLVPGLKGGFSPRHTPVNTFRVIFNYLFQAGMELLPDRSYAFVDLNHRYDFFDITEALRENGRVKGSGFGVQRQDKGFRGQGSGFRGRIKGSGVRIVNHHKESVG